MKIISPLEQFEINPIIQLGLSWLDFSITNSTITLLIGLGILITLTNLIFKKANFIPTRWQTLLEYWYQFNKQLVKDQIGEKGIPYFPLIFSVFSFIVLSNLMGMIPYSFTITTHLVITLSLSILIFVGVTILGFLHHGFHFLKIFLPSGAPLILAPLLIIIEGISYFARVISLAVRLTANMMAGHTLLKIISLFAWKMVLAGGLLSIAASIPLISLFLLIGLELAIAILQAYVFTVLTCAYLNDCINLH
jgi:ATP synthase subunit 6